MSSTTILLIGAALVALIFLMRRAEGPTGTTANNVAAQAHAAADPGLPFWAAATHTAFHATDETATPAPASGPAVEAASGRGHF